jgi:hypothetical protein
LGSAVRLADRPKENRKLTLSGEYQAPEFLVDDGASSENSAAELLSGQRILLAKLILATGIWLRFKIPIEYEYRFTEYEYEFDALDTGDEREVPFFLTVPQCSYVLARQAEKIVANCGLASVTKEFFTGSNLSCRAQSKTLGDHRYAIRRWKLSIGHRTRQ